MPGFAVSGEPSLLATMVMALVRETYAGADVRPGNAPSPGGVLVALEGTDRWLFVAAAIGPSPAAAEALSAGACAVLTLGASCADFGLAMRALVEGGRGFVPVNMARWLAGEALGRSSGTPGAMGLTVREREILQLVARGLSNAEIAETLMISPNTVRTHMHALSVKLEGTSRTKILAHARALSIPEAFAGEGAQRQADTRASA